MSLAPCWKPDAGQVSNAALSFPPCEAARTSHCCKHREKNKKMILMLLDPVLLQTGNAALPNLIDPVSSKPIVSNIQETHSCRIQDVCVRGLGIWTSFYKAYTGEWKAKRVSVLGDQVTKKLCFFFNSHPHPASWF